MLPFGARAAAVEKAQPQRPANQRRLCCPNADCGRDDSLRLIEQAQVSTPAVITDVGTTWPEMDLDHSQEEVKLRPRTVIGVSCAACQQSYIGPDPLSRLRLPA